MRYNYKLDQETLVFKKQHASFKTVIRDNYWKGILGVIIASVFWIVFFSGNLESPESVLLEQRNERLVKRLSSLNAQFDSINNHLALIQHRDDNLYRVVSQLDPIPASERKMGFGGVNSYQALEGYLSSDLLIESNKRSDILKRQMYLQSKSFDTVFSSVLKLNDSLSAVPGISPVSPYDYHRISSPFGYRIHPITGKYQKHDGLDFAARIGKPIYATGSGIVVRSGNNRSGYGNLVTLKHGFGYVTNYAHLDEIFVNVGDTVVRGQQIGTVGNTGSSTGPHLHYEVVYNRRKINPSDYYVNDLSAVEFDKMLERLNNSN